ncbi:hypothetical protein B0H63DRAFT_144289 [Podospora didyma]|uniref:F-box domain-containing protein n=1 Tax=Podospora didyma TaxID=330526 RepID=A0AAE0NSQ2_9PEZI|nr:hypothetical protein B0H63DRAFT_144289 [Podospora didyma]
MDTTLADQLLALGNNGPLRSASLRNLASSLTLDEVRDLLKQLSAVDFRTDIVARLPVELRVCVASYLEKDDIASLLNVSKQWRQIWLQEDVMKLLADHCFPGLRQQQFNTQMEGQNTCEEQLETTGRDAFLYSVRKAGIRSQGKFRSIFYQTFENDEPYYPSNHFQLDPDFNRRDPKGGGHYPKFMPHGNRVKLLYRSGRLAWMPLATPQDMTVFVVDDLRTRLRRVYTAPDQLLYGPHLTLLDIGDKLVVGEVSRRLHAWHLETNQHMSALFPNVTGHTRTWGTRVYTFDTTVLQIYMWQFDDGRVRELDMQHVQPTLDEISGHQYGLTDYKKLVMAGGMGVLFHPLNEATVFFVFQASPTAVAVFEFEDGDYVGAYTHTKTRPRMPVFMGDWQLSSPQISSDGLYLIVVLEKSHQIPYPFVVLRFDTRDRSFSTRTYHAAVATDTRHVTSLRYAAIWNDQLIAWHDLKRPTILTVRDSSGRAKPEQLHVPVYSAEKDKTGKIMQRKNKNTKFHDPTDFDAKNGDAKTRMLRLMMTDARTLEGLVGDAIMGPTARYCLELPVPLPLPEGRTTHTREAKVDQELFADDEFIILYHGNTVVIWSFFLDIQ